MANTHIQPGEVIDVQALSNELLATKTCAMFRTDDLEVIRMVLPQGKHISEHKAPGSITVQVVEGEIEFTSMGKTQTIRTGQLVYLESGQPHSVRAITDSSFLLTIVR